MAQCKKSKSNRIDELINVLNEIEGKVVIWSHWQSDVKQINKYLSDRIQVKIVMQTIMV